MEIKVPSSRDITENNKVFKVYQVEVCYRGWEHSFEKRYSEFLELHRVMKLLRRVHNVELPHFPGQMVWKQLFSKLNSEDVELRRRGLETYLQELVGTECARRSRFFMEFIEMPSELRGQWLKAT